MHKIYTLWYSLSPYCRGIKYKSMSLSTYQYEKKMCTIETCACYEYNEKKTCFNITA